MGIKLVSSLCDDGAIDFNKSTFLKAVECTDVVDTFWETVWNMPEYMAISEQLGKLEFNGDEDLTLLVMNVGRGFADFILNLPCVKVIFDK